MQKLDQLKQHFPQPGRVDWIGVRPDKGMPMTVLDQVIAIEDYGLQGDKAGSRAGGKRQVTLIQMEYLKIVQSLLPQLTFNLADLRRNIGISGINLNALKGCVVQLGEAQLEITGFCHPCNKLENQLGYGVFNALRGHGGLTAKVIQTGDIKLGDGLSVIKNC